MQQATTAHSAPIGARSASGDTFLLSDLSSNGSLPCYVNLSNRDAAGVAAPAADNQLYLHKVFEANCLFAKCYSNILENYILHHRPSYAPSEATSAEVTVTASMPLQQQLNPSSKNAKYLFNDIVSIPLNYKGLFEIFTHNSKKAGGILDHERDLISFASRLKKPKMFYVAKEMRLYELVADKRLSLFTTPPCKHQQKQPCETSAPTAGHSCRKWTKFSRGTICRAIKVVNVDYDADCGKREAGFWQRARGLCCCRLFACGVKRTDRAIEFKIVDNFDEITHGDPADAASDNDEEDEDSRRRRSNQPLTTTSAIRRPPSTQSMAERHERISATATAKSYFLPLYDSGGGGGCGGDANRDIDLIPLSSLKTDIFESNSLQTITNLILNNNLIDDCIDLKLFDEDPFLNFNNNNNSSSKSNSKSRSNSNSSSSHSSSGKSSETIHSGGDDLNLNDLVKMNQHLELDKYLSIFEIIEFKASCQILVGYSLTDRTLFFTPIQPLNVELPPDADQISYSLLDTQQLLASDSIRQFEANREHFVRLAQVEIDNFERNLNKMETFSLLGANRSHIQSIEQFVLHQRRTLAHSAAGSHAHNAAYGYYNNSNNNNNANNGVVHFADLINMDWPIEIIQSNLCENIRRIKQVEAEISRRREKKYKSLPSKVLCRSVIAREIIKREVLLAGAITPNTLTHLPATAPEADTKACSQALSRSNSLPKTAARTAAEFADNEGS